MPLMEPASDHPQQKELEAISNIIDSTPTICERVLQELNKPNGSLNRGVSPLFVENE